ncbi:MAG: DUF3574 domain-containing protein [Nitrospirae bacterium]|nr:DUF3574 domain-containing protein [Candidatus Manganitrophaceae bacterium]
MPFKKRFQFLMLALLSLAVFSGCAGLEGSGRPAPPFVDRQGGLLVSDTLFFGLNTPHGPVSEIDWNHFVREIITARFPEGFTTWDANGQWRGSGGEIILERSKVVQILHRDTLPAESAIQEIIARYKGQFDQQSVLRTRNVVQAWF